MLLQMEKRPAAATAERSKVDQLASQIDAENRPKLTEAQVERRLYRQAEKIHHLGVRPLYELIAEVIGAHPELESRVEAYAAIDGEFVRAIGGDRLTFTLELVPAEFGGDE